MKGLPGAPWPASPAYLGSGGGFASRWHPRNDTQAGHMHAYTHQETGRLRQNGGEKDGHLGRSITHHIVHIQSSSCRGLKHLFPRSLLPTGIKVLNLQTSKELSRISSQGLEDCGQAVCNPTLWVAYRSQAGRPEPTRLPGRWNHR